MTVHASGAAAVDSSCCQSRGRLELGCPKDLQCAAVRNSTVVGCSAPWRTASDLDAASNDLADNITITGSSTGLAGQRRQWYGVVVEALIRPERSRIGREYSVESLLMSVLPMPSAERARAAVKAR